MSTFVSMKSNKVTQNGEQLVANNITPIAIDLPSLKFMNLDELITECEFLLGIQSSIEHLITQVLSKLKEFNSEYRPKSQDKLIAEFKWNKVKYGNTINLHLITEVFKKEVFDIQNEYERLVEKYDELSREYQVLNTKINGSLAEKDIAITAVEMKLNKELELLTQFFITSNKDSEKKLSSVVQEIDAVSENIETFTLDKKNRIFIIYGLKSKENEILESLNSAGFSARVISKNQKCIEDMKSTLILQQKELELQENILCAFIMGNIEELISLLLHVLITKIWSEGIMLHGLPATDYDCFYIAGKDSMKKLKKYYASINRKDMDQVSYYEMKDMLK